MAYPVPHRFPTLRNSGAAPQRRSLLLIGAGMSYGIAPFPPKLLEEKGAKASAAVGCNPPTATESLYAWADRAIAHLNANHDTNPKLTLGKSLDLLSEPRWLGFAATERSSPRHRVVARFSREGLWEQVWSLNWDCVQESALENVGIARNGTDPRLPWPTGFRTFVTAAECQQAAEENMIHVIKPHGCVRALADAERAQLAGNLPRSRQLASRFLITQTELDALAPAGDPAQTYIFATLCSRLSGHPLVTVGWSASERYLLDHIETHVRPQLDQQTLAADELSIIDLAFHYGHPRLAQCYKKTPAQAHVPVLPANFTTDDLFLWIQTLYGLERLRMAANGRADDIHAIEGVEATLVLPPDVRHYAAEWVDSFLPVWVRLCWRCGLVECFDRQNHLLSVEEFSLERRDEHVPWNLSGCARPDLIAAAILLAALQRNGSGTTWDFATFPGGMYRVADSLLVIPLPAWRTAADNGLRGLRPLLTALQSGGGFPVQRMAVLPLTTSDVAADAVTVAVLKESLARQIGVAAFAQSDKIDAIRLADL